MGNRVKIERICEQCGQIFIAQTYKTRFCSKACNARHYKESIRTGRYNMVTKEVRDEVKRRIKYALDEIEVIQVKQYITIKQTGLYLGVSRKSVYNYIKQYAIPFSKIGGRVIIERNEIDKIMIQLIQSIKCKEETPIKTFERLTNFYSLKEIEEKYHVTYGHIYTIVKDNDIPFVSIAGHKYYSIKHIDKYFYKMGYKEAEEITEWYTIEDIQKRYDMTISAVHSFTSRHKIPKKKEKSGNTTLYSKKHIDEIKTFNIGEAGYVTIPEACAMFNVDRNTVYNRCKWHNIPKINKGRYVIVSVSGLQKVFGTGNISINNVKEDSNLTSIEMINNDNQNE